MSRLVTHWTAYPNFTLNEMRCRGQGCCGGMADMREDFMTALQYLRDHFGKPLPVTSGYRCPRHNADIGGGPAHPHGCAVDVSIRGDDALELLGLAIRLGWRGIGVKQHGTNRFLHLDLFEGTPEAPRPWLWSYT